MIKKSIKGLLPVALLIIFLFFFLNYGPAGVFKGNIPPIEEIFIQRVELSPEHVTAHLFNDGPEPVTISQLLVKDIYWQFTIEPSNTLEPLQHAKVHFAYPWIEGDPLAFTLLSSTGVTFEKEVEVAMLTPRPNWLYTRSFILLGLYVGVIPVLLGLLWFPFLRRLKGGAYDFLLALTVGLLIFLGFDALEASFELFSSIPGSLNSIGILLIGFFLSILTLSAITHKTAYRKKSGGERKKRLLWAYLIALGIGLHNLGEGLAIGSAYSLGEIALGGTLVIGFMVHNLTEGIAIISPLTRTYKRIEEFLGHIIVMGLLAGVPTIIGALMGGFAFSPAIALFFLAIGAGAIFDVSFDILVHMARGDWRALFTMPNVTGFFTGLLIMYGTGFLVIG